MECLGSPPSFSPMLARVGLPEKPRASICQALRLTAFPGGNCFVSVSRSSRRWRPLLAPAGTAASASPSEGDNGVTASTAPVADTSVASLQASRVAVVDRVTKETNVHVRLNLDGSGIAECSSGIPFLDHMLDQLASHGLFDVIVKASGDIHIDDHHTNEDVALAIGTALLKALGDRKGICRFGNFSAPLDEAAVSVILDLSGRPHLSYDLHIPTERVGNYDTQLVEHFFQSLVNTSGMTLHIKQAEIHLFVLSSSLLTQADFWKEFTSHYRGDIQGLCKSSSSSDRV